MELENNALAIQNKWNEITIDNKAEILSLVIAQINKDLFPYATLSESVNSLKGLLDSLKIAVEQMTLHSSSELMQVLYRVDINEHRISRLFATMKPEELNEEISALIVLRCLQKVLLRKMTS